MITVKKSIAVICAAVMMTVSLLVPGRFGINKSLKASAATTVANPVIWSDVPDCDIIRVGDTYYMVSTTMFFSPGAPIMKSKDLVSWEICSYVYDTLADGDVQNLTNGKHDYAHGQWAASLRYNKGTFYVFFGSYGTGKSYIYKTTDIENGTWTRSELNGMYHDASMIFDDDGRNYLVYGGGGEIKIKEFNSEMTDFKWGGLDKTLFKTGLDGLAGEGSHIQKIGDYYYVFVIAWPSGSGRIELCYRSREIGGNYEGKTVLNSGVGTYGSGVAQGGIVDTPDGKWYGLLFQDHGSVGRIPVLVPVTWQDNWPMMGVNGKAPVTLTVDTDDYYGAILAKDDDFDYSENKLALEWQWNHNPDNTAWSVTQRDGWLRLTNKTLATNIINARNTLTQRTEGPACSSVIKLDTKGMKAGDYAGLSAFQFKYGNVGVHVNDDGSKKVYMSENGGYSGNAQITDSRDKIVEEKNMSGDEVYLKVDFKFNNVDANLNCSNNIDKVNFFYSFDGSSWTKIGSELSMAYDLKMFTGYRSGIYSYATKNLGGYADIDFFDYERADWNNPTATKPTGPVEPNDFGWYFACSFEGSNDKWTTRWCESAEPVKTEHYVGDHSLYVSGRGASYTGAQYTLDKNAFKAGEEYSFSTHVMYKTGAKSVLFQLSLEYKDASGETCYDHIAQSYAIPGKWVQLVNTNYTIPAGATGCKIYVETADDSTVSFYMDEAIGAVAGTGIAGEGPMDEMGVPGAVKITPGDVNFDGKINVFDLVAAKRGLKDGFKNPNAESAADVNKSTVTDAEDIKELTDFLLGKLTEFTDQTPPAPPEPEKPVYTMKDYTEMVEKQVIEYDTNDSRQEKPGTQYGTIKKESYYSEICKRTKPYNVLLPAGYDESKKYPVLYCMHGYWENQNRMIIEGNGTMYTRQIIGNAIAEGAAEDMIVVFPYIYSSTTQDDCNAMDEPNNQAYDNFMNVLTKELMPLIESKYSVKTGKENTAITGFSMGGRESLNIGMKYGDKFGYVGAICPAPGASGDFRWNSGDEPYLVFITAGSDDTVVYTTPNGYHDNFTKNGVPHIWHYVKGGYHGDNSIHAHIYNFVRAIFKA